MSEVPGAQTTPIPTQEPPSYLELVGPIYRENALAELLKVHELSAAVYSTLKADPLNLSALEAITQALDASYRNFGVALAGMGAAISCTGSA